MGGFITFVSVSGGVDRLIVAATDGSAVLDRTPATQTPTQGIWRPTYSPDGTMIAFTVVPADNPDNGQLFVMRSDGTGLRALPTKPVSTGNSGGPDWSPDPRVQLIAYESLVSDALTCASSTWQRGPITTAASGSGRRGRPMAAGSPWPTR
jgi:Tol biopolymer transport system component